MRYRQISFRYTEVVSRHMARLLGDPWAMLQRPTIARPQWKPPADLYETDSAYVIKVELPGVNEDDIEVTVYPDALTVEGVRRCATAEGRYYTAEIRYGPFRLEVQFPSLINPEKVTATSEAGFLVLTVAKVEGTR